MHPFLRWHWQLCYPSTAHTKLSCRGHISKEKSLSLPFLKGSSHPCPILSVVIAQFHSSGLKNQIPTKHPILSKCIYHLCVPLYIHLGSALYHFKWWSWLPLFVSLEAIWSLQNLIGPFHGRDLLAYKNFILWVHYMRWISHIDIFWVSLHWSVGLDRYLNSMGLQIHQSWDFDQVWKCL